MLKIGFISASPFIHPHHHWLLATIARIKVGHIHKIHTTKSTNTRIHFIHWNVRHLMEISSALILIRVYRFAWMCDGDDEHCNALRIKTWSVQGIAMFRFHLLSVCACVNCISFGLWFLMCSNIEALSPTITMCQSARTAQLFRIGYHSVCTWVECSAGVHIMYAVVVVCSVFSVDTEHIFNCFACFWNGESRPYHKMLSILFCCLSHLR